MSDLDLTPNWHDALRQAHQAEVPPTLRDKVLGSQRPPLPKSIEAATFVLGFLFVQHGLGNFVIGKWIAEQTGGHYDAHSFREGGFAILGLGILTLAAAFRRAWLRPAAIAGIPVGLAFGINGLPEVTTTLAGFALHAAEGVAALVLAAAWWRYARRRRRQEKA